MVNLESKLESGLLGMTVYSPDVYASGISGDIDEFIARRTGLIPVLRHKLCHSSASIERFYATGVHKNVPNWHHVVDFFTGGPSLITFWYGEEALDKLSAVKGKSHPARAAADTVRGHFFCDNAVCNLIHTSDDVPEMIRELTAAECYGLLKAPFTGKAVPCEDFSQGEPELRHNGAYTFLKVMGRILGREINADPGNFEGSAELYGACIGELRTLAEQAPSPERKLISAFLRGDETVAEELEKYGASAQERFIIACSAATRSGWEQQTSLIDAVTGLLGRLEGIEGFFIGGSTAARLYGYKCLPDDIDVICTTGALEAIAERLGLKIKRAEKSFGTYSYCSYSFAGYEVEFSTMADYAKGYKILIDSEMLARSAGRIPLMPPEDLICELYSLSRTDYHDDIVRAKKYRSFFGDALDMEYLRRRFIDSGIGQACLADLIG